MQSTWHHSQHDISLKLDATEKRHGVVSLKSGENQPEIVREPLFLLNIYRVLADGKLCAIARDEPFTAQWQEDGLALHWQPTETLPLEMWARYRVDKNAALTLQLRVRAARDLRDLEISVSSYFDFAYEPYGVLKVDPQDGSRQKQPLLWKAEDQPFLRGHYIHLPRDDHSSVIRMDGRWNDDNGQSIAPAVYGPHYGWPVAAMACADPEFFVVQTCSRESCAAISLTYSSQNTKDNIRNHNALYFSLFGHNFKAGEEREAILSQEMQYGKPTLERIAAMIERDNADAAR